VRQLRWQRPPRAGQCAGISKGFRGGRRCQLRICGQDLLMKTLKRGRGLDAEFFAQSAARVPECRQCIRLAVGSVQRHHEQAVQPLT
jgi:hypothetical protein